MKVKALVVAAMVITSVNAGLHRRGEDSPSKASSSGEEQSANGSNTGSTVVNPICSIVYAMLKGLQTKIYELDEESYIYQAVISEMNNRSAWVLAKQVETHYESYNVACAKLEASKEQSTNLKREYLRIFQTRGFMGCDEAVFHTIFEKDGILFSPI
ncbi:hypothetical protein BASA50_004325 [Batrachochytrium salamandrivorans]|uniref:Uncharacterized protein n=1 Tax=Batrachochytrium salamandrivorans TaxID=1357716 RepID=A0ABQ8FG22_9FUNG|nr:hypothetical protein BASA50_004325 [Batrachochytrium salamandrivorans]